MDILSGWEETRKAILDGLSDAKKSVVEEILKNQSKYIDEGNKILLDPSPLNPPDFNQLFDEVMNDGSKAA